jgi:hypothetical protein
MKLKIAVLLIFVFVKTNFSQSINPIIENQINQTNLDSLISYVRILTGEDSTSVTQPRGDAAADYIKQKLESFGLEVHDQRYSQNGRNIFAIQEGITFPVKQYICCAHYDAKTDYCADDNASGVAAVLESARILSKYLFDYTIIYAFWDEEEIGSTGSFYYASQADSNNVDIQGVINLDMIGWDGDNDSLMEVHARNIGNSNALANVVIKVDSLYGISVNPTINFPGNINSDHSSFWWYGYGAICLSESYGDDFNPYYHSAEDRIDKFNLAYFHNIVKLAVASIATAAENPGISSIEKEKTIPESFKVLNYPNPFNNTTIIHYEILHDGITSVSLYNSIGQKIKELVSGYQKAGSYNLQFNAKQMSSGVYFVVLKSYGQIMSHKIVLMK